jgi:hypothetical protein
MKTKIAFIAQVIVALPFGIGFIAAPGELMSVYHNDPLIPQYIYLTRLYGSMSFGIGMVALFGILFNDLRARRGLAAGLGLFTLSHCILFIIGTVQGTINAMGWVQVGITGVLTVLYGVSLLTEKA